MCSGMECIWLDLTVISVCVTGISVQVAISSPKLQRHVL